MKKRFILLLAALMCVSVMTACSQNSTGEEEETTFRDLPRFDYMSTDVLSRVTISQDVYASMNLTLPAELEITDEAVEEYIFSLRLNKRTPTYQEETETETVTDIDAETETENPAHVKDQPLRLGDDAYIYYKGVLNGEAFDGGSNMEDKTPYKLTLGSGQFIPGFEEGLVGVIPNTTSREEPFALNVSFPENYGSADLAGKAVIFYVVVEYAVQYEIPEFDREFVLTTMKYKTEKDVEEYADDNELLGEYRGYVRQTLEEQIAADVDNAKVEAMWEYLVSKVTCRDLPAEEINYYYGQYVESVESTYEQYMGMYGEQWTTMYPSVDTFAVVYIGLDKGADWKAELRKQAEKPVMQDMIRYAIAEIEGMKSLSQAEFDEEVQYYIDYYKSYNVTKTYDEIIEEVGETYIRTVAFQIKMDDWLKEKCTFIYGE